MPATSVSIRMMGRSEHVRSEIRSSPEGQNKRSLQKQDLPGLGRGTDCVIITRDKGRPPAEKLVLDEQSGQTDVFPFKTKIERSLVLLRTLCGKATLPLTPFDALKQ